MVNGWQRTYKVYFNVNKFKLASRELSFFKIGLRSAKKELYSLLDQYELYFAQLKELV